MKAKAIIYIAPSFSSFVRKDIQILARHFTVNAPAHNWSDKYVIPFTMLKQLVFLLAHIRRSSAVFVMFGGYWSFLPSLSGRIFRRKVFIIPGGTDCVSFPSLGYGSLRKPLLRTIIRISYSLCSQLLPVDRSLVFTHYSYLEHRDYDFQGYRFFFPRLKTGHTVIYNGFDDEQISYDPNLKKPGTFITVAPVNDARRFRIKGIDKVVSLAHHFPEISFTVVGISAIPHAFVNTLPGNIRFLPFLPFDEFREELRASEFYLQLSVSEGFPNALCEGMLAGCIPVVSSVGAMPMIAGNTGYVIESDNEEYLRKHFLSIISMPADEKARLAAMARDRVVTSFPLSEREKAFVELLGGNGL